MTPGISEIQDSKYQSRKADSLPSSPDPELVALDHRLRYITETILPSTPYLLKLHSDRPFNTGPHQDADLIRYTPFHVGEEHLQYLSFSATFWDDSLITPVGGWEEDDTDDISNSPYSQKMQSANVTPKVAAKKITMSEYRKRAAGQSSTNGTPKVNGDVRHESSKHGGTSSAEKQGALPAQSKKDLKRSREDLESKESKDYKQNQSQQLSKKARLTSDSAPAAQDAARGKNLSLPGPISPTLPPLFEKKLAEIAGPGTSDSGATQQSRPEKSASLESGSAKALGKAKAEATKIDPGAQRLSSKEVNAKKELGKTNGIPLSNGLGISISSKESKSRNTDRPPADGNSSNLSIGAERTEKQSHEQKQKESKLVRLKISRSIRKAVSRLLQLKPQPKSNHIKIGTTGIGTRESSVGSNRDSQAAPNREGRMSANLRGDQDMQRQRSKSSVTDSSKAGEKRPREDGHFDSVQSLSKKQKRQESKSPPAFRSPIMSSRAGIKKPRESTPATSVKEETVGTPLGSIRNGTPVAPSSVERPGREARHTPSASGSSHSASSEAHDALRVEQHKYFELGKLLKKESDRIYKPGQSADVPSVQVMKKYLATRLEVTLAFMLAYIIGDEMRRIERAPLNFERSWTTLFPWLRQLQQQTMEYTYLRGLSLQLEAICHLVVWNIEADQAAAASSSGSEKPETAKALKRRYDEAQRMLIEGSSLLSVDDLQQEFPKTWRSKARAPLAHSPPKLTSTTLGGDFYLPVTGITLPIEAVRAGRSLLVEWCKMEGVDWAPKLNI